MTLRNAYRPTRCVDGRTMRHDPQHDDPELETDIGRCPECSGNGCIECEECGCTAPDATDDGDSLCDNCQQNRAEAAWERHCEDFHDGGATRFNSLHDDQAECPEAERRYWCVWYRGKISRMAQLDHLRARRGVNLKKFTIRQVILALPPY